MPRNGHAFTFAKTMKLFKFFTVARSHMPKHGLSIVVSLEKETSALPQCSPTYVAMDF